MPNRNIQDANAYRYAYQGQEKDPETGKEAFELRLWDGRIGRWLSVDPYSEFFSPYLGMGNNPISNIDVNGGCIECPDGVKGDTWTDDLGTVWTHDGTDWGGGFDQGTIKVGRGWTVGEMFGVNPNLGYGTQNIQFDFDTAGNELHQPYNVEGRQVGWDALFAIDMTFAALSAGQAGVRPNLRGAKQYNPRIIPSKSINYNINKGGVKMNIDVKDRNYVIMQGSVHGTKTSVGGFFSRSGNTITIDGADFAGKIGYRGIKDFARQFGNSNGVNNIIINTAKRTTGANPGKVQHFNFNF